MLGAEDFRRTGIGDVEHTALGIPANFPVLQAEELEARIGTGEVELHPLLVDDAAAVGELRLLSPTTHLVEGTVDHAGGAEGDALVVELAGDELPSLVLAADEVLR